MSLRKESARLWGGELIVSCAPDVCLKTVGTAVVWVPFPITAKLSDSAATCSHVNMTGNPTFTLESHITCCKGDAPGDKKGIKSGTTEGICEPIGHSGTVRAEGANVVRDGDCFNMNNCNTCGILQCKKDMGSYEVAQANIATGQPVYSDAAPSGKPKPNVPANDNPRLRVVPKSTPPPKPSWLSRLARIGARAAGSLGILYEMNEFAARERAEALSDPEGYLKKFGYSPSDDPVENMIYDRAAGRLRSGELPNFVREDLYRDMREYRNLVSRERRGDYLLPHEQEELNQLRAEAAKASKGQESSVAGSETTGITGKDEGEPEDPCEKQRRDMKQLIDRNKRSPNAEPSIGKSDRHGLNFRRIEQICGEFGPGQIDPEKGKMPWDTHHRHIEEQQKSLKNKYKRYQVDCPDDEESGITKDNIAKLTSEDFLPKSSEHWSVSAANKALCDGIHDKIYSGEAINFF